jgi:hypothetical protein
MLRHDVLAWAEGEQNKSYGGIPNVCLCIPHTGYASLEWVESTYGPLRFIPQPDFVKTHRIAKGYPVDVERNFLVKAALEDKTVSHILFLDTDCISEGDPNQYLRSLLSINVPIVSGLYRAKKSRGEYPYCMMMKNPQTKTGKWDWIDGFVPIVEWTGNFICADVIGLGFSLIKREVFEKVPYPWFIWDVDFGSEDFRFCIKAKECGFEVKVFTECRFSHCGGMKVKFDGNVHLLDV